MTVKVTVPKGRTVLDARGRKCPAEVFSVNERDPFWARLLRFGDIVPVDAKPVTETKPVAVSVNKEAAPK